MMKSLVFLFVFSLVVGLGLGSMGMAQQGLGELYTDSLRKNRPVKTTEISHSSGTKVWFFQLPGGACRSQDCKADRERTELIQSRPDNIEGRDYRYTFSVYFPNDMPDVAPTNLIIWQLKPHGNGKPSVTMEMRGNEIKFVLHNPNALQQDKMNPLKPVVIQSVTRKARGRWLDFVVDARWSRGADGYVKVQLNGRQVASHRGQNIDENSKKQRLRFGLYRSFLSRYKSRTGTKTLPLQTSYFANVSRRHLN